MSLTAAKPPSLPNHQATYNLVVDRMACISKLFYDLTGLCD